MAMAMLKSRTVVAGVEVTATVSFTTVGDTHGGCSIIVSIEGVSCRRNTVIKREGFATVYILCKLSRIFRSS